MAPESATLEIALEKTTSFRSVAGWPCPARSVATAPPEGGTGALVNVRSPSPAETQTTMPSA